MSRGIVMRVHKVRSEFVVAACDAELLGRDLPVGHGGPDRQGLRASSTGSGPVCHGGARLGPAACDDREPPRGADARRSPSEEGLARRRGGREPRRGPARRDLRDARSETEPMPGEFCVVCGRTDVPVEEGVCADCYAKRHPLVAAPERADGRPLPDLRRAAAGRTGRAAGAPRPCSAPRTSPVPRAAPGGGDPHRRVDGRRAPPAPPGDRGRMSTLRFRGTERTELVRFTVKVEHRTCTECSRRPGHYYTAIIQLRGRGGRLAGEGRRAARTPAARVGRRRCPRPARSGARRSPGTRSGPRGGTST